MTYRELSEKFRKICIDKLPDYDVVLEIADDLADFAYDAYMDSDKDESSILSSLKDIVTYGVEYVYFPKYTQSQNLSKVYKEHIFDLDELARLYDYEQSDTQRFITLPQEVVWHITYSIVEYFNDYV